MSNALKPCPFCGEPASLIAISERGSYAACRNPECACQPELCKFLDTIPNVTERWNTRAETPGCAELLAACKEFVRKVDCGEAQSTRSYAEMKAAIAKAEGGDS